MHNKAPKRTLFWQHLAAAWQQNLNERAIIPMAGEAGIFLSSRPAERQIGIFLRAMDKAHRLKKAERTIISAGQRPRKGRRTARK
jgi:hypothetical protein